MSDAICVHCGAEISWMDLGYPSQFCSDECIEHEQDIRSGLRTGRACHCSKHQGEELAPPPTGSVPGPPVPADGTRISDVVAPDNPRVTDGLITVQCPECRQVRALAEARFIGHDDDERGVYLCPCGGTELARVFRRGSRKAPARDRDHHHHYGVWTVSAPFGMAVKR